MSADQNNYLTTALGAVDLYRLNFVLSQSVLIATNEM